MKTSNKHRLYILMRNDMPSLNPGKAMAQASHASNQFVHEWNFKKPVAQWTKEAEGFGTTVVLSVDEQTLMSVLKKANKLKVPCGLVVDKTYPMIVTREIASLISPSIQTAIPIFKDDGNIVIFIKQVTCGYVFIENNSKESKDLLGSLPLHP